MADQLAGGKSIQTGKVPGDFNRDGLCSEANFSLTTERVVRCSNQ